MITPLACHFTLLTHGMRCQYIAQIMLQLLFKHYLSCCVFFYDLGRSLPHFERSHTSGYLSYHALVKHVIYRKISTRISFCLYLVQTGRWETAISKVNFLVFHSLRIMD
ncbi:unnamed protein product [Ixodes persulcatus]